MKAGQTVAATIPAAVIALALFRVPRFRGGVLEQNITRTAASVGEALVAGAIFTIPAFLLVEMDGTRLWTDLRSHYWQAAFILLAGGLIGVFFIILLRRPLCVESDLPFPESVASAEIVKAGDRASDAPRYMFGAMGFAALIQILKTDHGLLIFREFSQGFLAFPRWLVRSGSRRRGCHARRRHRLDDPEPLAGPDRHRLHHRAAAFGHQRLGRRDRVVAADPADEPARPESRRAPGTAGERFLGYGFDGRLVQRRPADRGRDDARGRLQHAVLDARFDPPIAEGRVRGLGRGGP